MKQNDWIVATINNPSFNEADFKNVLGLTLDNTLLLPMESYLKSKFITENDLFKDDNGNFSKTKFEEFYKDLALKFGDFEKTSALDNYEYGFWDIYQKPDSRVQDPDFNLDVTINPDHISYGVVGPNMEGDRSKSDFELAEKQKIFDWEKGEYKDLTPEDYALFSNPIRFIENLFSDPLVLAEYELDEIDPVTGEVHEKGLKKLNDKGEYYFETLGNRSLVGKKVLSVGDILSKEDTLINKYDFFDSDDLLKSVPGVIAKNIAAIAPMAILGTTGAAWYAGFYIAREIAKSLPMLNSMLHMWTDTEDPKLLNTIAGIGEKFTGGTSDYAKNTTFSFENFGNLISDVALQWGQLKLIANSIARVKGNANAIMDAAETKAAVEYEKRAKEIWNRANNGEQIAAFRYTGAKNFDDIKNVIASGNWKSTSVGAAAMQKFVPEAQKAFSKQAQMGLDLSLIYMSIISNYDVYNDAIERGATPAEAAAVALGSTAGMFMVDKYAHLGEIFFDETPEKMAIRNLRQGIRDEAAELTKRIGSKEGKEVTKKGLIGLMLKSANKTSEFIKNYLSGLKHHTLGFFGKAFGEGLEEMSEEAVTDVAKSLYQLAGQFGYVSQTDIGAWDNMRERYLMSLFGGAIGGGLFYGVDAIRNPKNTVDQNILRELLYLVSQGKTGDILDNLEDMRKKGKLASKDLSIDTVDDKDGNKVFLTADKDHKSLNDYVYDVMKNSILLMESILNEHSLKLTDDLLFEKMVLSNQRYMNLKANLFDKSYITLYYDDFQQLVSDIYNVEKKIQDLKDSTKDEDKREDNSTYLEKLKNLEKEKSELLKRKESFLKGEYNLDYVDKMLFYIHPEINGAFYSSMYELWVQEKYHKDVSELSEGERKKYSEEWTKLKKTQGKQFLNKAFDMYKGVRSDIEAGLKEVEKDDVTKWGEVLQHINESSPENQGLSFDDRIPSKEINIDDYLDSLEITKSAEYDKPWESDPTKTNKAFQLLLNEDSSSAFEIVKDHEDGYWSIHFKTPRTLTMELKQRLFRAAAAVIPEGDKLSTYGAVSLGGLSGINRFGQLDFIDGIEFLLDGTRKVKMRSKNFSLLSKEELADEVIKYNEILANTTSPELDKYVYEQILNLNELLQENDLDTIDLSPYTMSSKGDLSKLEDVEIPIWLKVITGESDEDYNDRKTRRNGEDEKAFRMRQQARANKIDQYNIEHLTENIRKFLNVNDIIDRGTYRRLIAKLGARRSDVLKFVIKGSKLKSIGLVTALNKKEFNDIVFDCLSKLLPDLSNSDEIIEEIITKTRKLRNREFNNRNKHRKVVLEETRLPDSMDDFDKATLIELDTIAFDDLINALNLNWSGLEISISENVEPGIVTLSLVKDELYIMLNGENSVLFNEALENAIRIHNMGLDASVDHTAEIDAIRSEMNLKNYVKLNSDGSEVIEDYLFINDGYGAYENERDETVSIQESFQRDELLKLIDRIGSNKDLQVMNELHRKATLDLNPVVKILKAVLPKLGEDFGDIEETLESIYNLFESLEVPTSFTLSTKQLAALDKAGKYLDYVWRVVQAAKTRSSYFDYLPYNHSINEFIRDNKSVIKDVEELLELDEDLANVISESFAHFNEEIKAWIRMSERGTINKREMFSKFDLKFNKARLDFFNQIKDLCKVGEKDLFKGFEHIDVDKPDAIVEIEKLIYNNFKSQDWSLDEFMPILEKQVVVKNVINQDSGFNKSLDSDFVLTDYDKFILLTSLVATDPVDFYEFYKGYVASSKGKNGLKLAPLTFQEYNIKLGYIHKNAMPFINEVMESFVTRNKIKTNVLKNAFVISGIAGVGKTDVVVRALQNSSSVWVSGPSDTQIDGLKKIIPHAQTMGHKELFNSILGATQYSEILSEVKECTTKRKKEEAYKGKYISSTKVDLYPTIIDGAVTFVTKDAPSLLVIDEVTLFSNTELLLLSQWADLTGCQLIFAGDKHQNGDGTIGFNIAEDFTFAFRSPEMKISLRDANIWKYKNQLDIVSQLDELEKYGKADIVKKYLSNFNFHYYLNEDKFTGELVTDLLSDNVLKNLKGTLGFIGSTSSRAYQKLKETGRDIKVFESVEKIQGEEFDYVVVDIDLDYKPIEGFSDFYNLQRYLNNLYTIITRSKNGTVLIDNGLTNMIKGSVAETYSNDNVGITPEITEQYVNDKINFLNSLNLLKLVPTKPLEEPLTEETVIEGEEYEDEEPELEEVEPETEDDSYLDVEALQGAIVPIYGNINFSGLVRDPSTKKLSKSGNRDLGIFLPDGALIEVKDRPMNSYFLLKSLILFDKLNKSWYRRLGHQVTDLFSLEDLQGIKYYVQAEDYDPQMHKFITKEAGYEDGKLKFAVEGVEKVFTLVGVIEKDGKEYEITLGGLSNPKTLLDNKDDKVVNGKTVKGTITRIRERAAQVSDPELKQKLLDYADNYSDKVENYRALLKDLINNPKWSIGEGRSRWQIKKPAFDKCTRISRMKNDDGSPRYEPLTGYFDTNTSQYVVSLVYTQVNKNGRETLFPGLDDKHKGKPVIFVSAFKLYNPDELERIYMELKKDPTNSSPEVRKIILDPRGIDFEDLVNFKVAGQENSDEKVFPFSNTSAAFKMYMSLWNFRAKITKFNDLVDKYITENGLSTDEIQQLAIEESRNPKSTDSKFKPLRDLNEYLRENGVQLFRLGYNAENGFYSRKIDDTTDGTYINYLMAKDYQNVVDLLFNNVLNKLIPPPSATTTKAIMSKTSDFDKLEDAMKTWVSKLHYSDVKLRMKSDDTDEEVNFQVKDIDSFRALPLYMVYICRNINLGQEWSRGFNDFRQLLKDDDSLKSWWYIKIRDKRTNEYESLDYLSIVDGLSGGIIETTTSGTHVLTPGVRAYDEITNEGNYDRRIINFFKLAFHGHVGDGAPADGLLLKYGIFADTFTVGKYDKDKAFKVVSTHRSLYRTNAIPSSPVIKADITPWDGKTSEDSKKEKEKKTENKELERVNRVLKTNLDSLDQIPTVILNNLNNIFTSAVGSRKVLNTVVEYSETSGVHSFKTVKLLIKEQTGLDITKVENNSDDSGVTYEFTTSDGKYIIYKDGELLRILKPEKVVNTVNDLEKFTQEFEKLLSSGLQDNIVTDLENNDVDTQDFDNFITDLLSGTLGLEDFKNVFNSFVSYVKDNTTDDVDITELSELLNILNKINC